MGSESADDLQPAESERPAEPALRQAPRLPVSPPAHAAPATDRSSVSSAAPRRSGENPLRTGLRDPRLWVAPGELPEPPEPTDHERYMAHLQRRIDALNDSIHGEAERSRRATDWTVTDKSGKKWGASPGKLHLGDVTLPLPGVQGNRDHEEAAAERNRRWEEIQRQEQEAERRRAIGQGGRGSGGN
jgi:hypothetical protein